MRFALRAGKAGLLLALLLPGTAQASSRQNVWSTRAIRAFSQALTNAGNFGPPRFATGSLPTCGATNEGGLATDTTLHTLVFCNGTTALTLTTSSSTLTLASATFANQGTTTTLLHGNAAGNPSWAGVSLTADTTANQGTTVTVLHGNGAGQPSFAVVTPSDAAGNTSGSGAFALVSGPTFTGTVLAAAATLSGNLTENGVLSVAPTGAASPAASSWLGQGSRGGTDSNVAGGNLTVGPGPGTGLAAGTQFNIQRNIMGTTGTTQQTQQNGITVCGSKTLSNTTATAQTLATVGGASNAAGGGEFHVTVTCSDGTNFDSETQLCTYSWVNKAGVYTFTGAGTPVCTATTAANNSGSCTIGATITGASPTISLKVTPAFTTIVPTTVTAYSWVVNNGAGAVACQ